MDIKVLACIEKLFDAFKLQVLWSHVFKDNNEGNAPSRRKRNYPESLKIILKQNF